MIKPFFVVTVGYYSGILWLLPTGLIKRKKNILGDVGLKHFFENVPTYSYSLVQLSYANQFVLLSNCGATLCYDDGHLGAASPARPVFWRYYYFSKPLPNFNTK